MIIFGIANIFWDVAETYILFIETTAGYDKFKDNFFTLFKNMCT